MYIGGGYRFIWGVEEKVGGDEIEAGVQGRYRRWIWGEMMRMMYECEGGGRLVS